MKDYYMLTIDTINGIKLFSGNLLTEQMVKDIIQMYFACVKFGTEYNIIVSRHVFKEEVEKCK